jgi:hypothetical protein
LVVDFLHCHGSIHPDQLWQVLECVFEGIPLLFLLDRFTLDAFDDPLCWVDTTDGTEARGNGDPNDAPKTNAMRRDYGTLGIAGYFQHGNKEHRRF